MQLGNFIGDAVKGSSYEKFPAAIREGILMHRAIDDFTDKHAAVKDAVRLLKPAFGRYSGVLLDIFFDHLLASRFSEFSDVPLPRFARRFYRTMIWNRRWLPARIRSFMWHFIGTGRLGKYASKEGVRRSLEIMARYRMDISPDEAVAWLTEHEEELWAVFVPFFGELQAFCADWIRNADK